MHELPKRIAITIWSEKLDQAELLEYSKDLFRKIKKKYPRTEQFSFHYLTNVELCQNDEVNTNRPGYIMQISMNVPAIELKEICIAHERRGEEVISDIDVYYNVTNVYHQTDRKISRKDIQ